MQKLFPNSCNTFTTASVVFTGSKFIFTRSLTKHLYSQEKLPAVFHILCEHPPRITLCTLYSTLLHPYLCLLRKAICNCYLIPSKNLQDCNPAHGYFLLRPQYKLYPLTIYLLQTQVEKLILSIQ